MYRLDGFFVTEDETTVCLKQITKKFTALKKYNAYLTVMLEKLSKYELNILIKTERSEHFVYFVTLDARLECVSDVTKYNILMEYGPYIGIPEKQFNLFDI